ncbi:FadR/GntR family transcriptional regulator [Prosthecomicrobium sp. N25]|uniref:FadR/GntR family transcriptional regulator n=1 Tax=Prosthecomicrobium sp. N25 TaxID=3129254 RepID=UPI003076E48F
MIMDAELPGPDPEGSPNAVTALERLRVRLEDAARSGERQLPPERQLAAELAVGRGALRRALEVLEAEGQIWRVQGKGTFLGSRPPSADGLDGLSSRTSPAEMMEVRLEVEPTLARLAALRATAEDIEMMRRVARRIAAAPDAEARELWDGALHHRIAEAAGNRLFVGLFELIDKVRQDATFQSLRERARAGAGQALLHVQHDRIIDRIAARDAAGAEAAMREHLETVARRLAAAMGGRVPLAPAAGPFAEGDADG